MPEDHQRLHKDQFEVGYTDLESDHHLLSAFLYWPRQLPKQARNRKVKRHRYEMLRQSAEGDSDARATFEKLIGEGFGRTYTPDSVAKGQLDKGGRVFCCGGLP